MAKKKSGISAIIWLILGIGVAAVLATMHSEGQLIPLLKGGGIFCVLVIVVGLGFWIRRWWTGRY